VGPPLLETLAAENRPAPGQLEGHRGFLAALRTRGGRNAALLHPPLCVVGLAAKHLTGLASLGLISETLFGVKELFAGGENKIGTTLDASENPVPILHIDLRLGR
jgi:hypothetical protein